MNKIISFNLADYSETVLINHVSIPFTKEYKENRAIKAHSAIPRQDYSHSLFFFFLNKRTKANVVFWGVFLNLFLAVLGLRFCARAFCSCGKREPLFIAVRGPLTIAASLVAEHRLQRRRLSSCGSRA